MIKEVIENYLWLGLLIAQNVVTIFSILRRGPVRSHCKVIAVVYLAAAIVYAVLTYVDNHDYLFVAAFMFLAAFIYAIVAKRVA